MGWGLRLEATGHYETLVQTRATIIPYGTTRRSEVVGFLTAAKEKGAFSGISHCTLPH